MNLNLGIPLADHKVQTIAEVHQRASDYTFSKLSAFLQNKYTNRAVILAAIPTRTFVQEAEYSLIKQRWGYIDSIANQADSTESTITAATTSKQVYDALAAFKTYLTNFVWL